MFELVIMQFSPQDRQVSINKARELKEAYLASQLEVVSIGQKCTLLCDESPPISEGLTMASSEAIRSLENFNTFSIMQIVWTT